MLLLGLAHGSNSYEEVTTDLQHRALSSSKSKYETGYYSDGKDSDDVEETQAPRYSIDEIQKDKKFTSFWNWYSPWETQQQCASSKREFNICKSKKKTLSFKVLKRKACSGSKLKSFAKEVESVWDDILETVFDFSWGCKKKKTPAGYGLWKKQVNYCASGKYLDSKAKCQPCPIGCTTCLGPDQCLTCQKNFTSVEGYSFGYCYPDCPGGKYVQHLYTDDVNFCKKNNCTKRAKSQNPTMMASQCESCPDYCDDCVFDEDTGRSFCYKCKRGFEFDQVSGQCLLSECEDGEFRLKEIPKSRVLSKKENVEDYICQDCLPGCKNCKSNRTCDVCKDYFVLSDNTANTNVAKTCQPCPSFCKNCVPGQNGKGVCAKCDDKFTMINNGTQCILNRTCALGSWFNDTLLSCQSCPSNCLTCKQGNRNGTVICTSCTPDMTLNNKTQMCMDKCNRLREYFNSASGSCAKCANRTYPDQTIQRCTPCSKNCEDCGFIVNTNISNIGFEECLTCRNDTKYDKQRKRCRTNCNSTAIFNFQIMDCASCRSDFYKNTTEDSCKICPNNCSSCEQAPDIWKVNCKECKQSNMTVDWTEKRCRPKCSNPTHFFDYKDYTCKPCPASTMINDDTKVCEKCPKGCTGCYKNTTSNVTECNKCDFGLVLDSGKRLCRPTCASWKTYYFETETCRECPPYQTYSYVTKNCTSCDFGCINCFSQMSNKTKPSCIDCGNGTLFDYKTWQCKIPCNSSTIFNYDTKTCEKCPVGQYLDTVWEKCKDCSTANCAVCDRKGFNENCTSCKTGFFIEKNILGKNTCRKQCEENTYYNETRKTCIMCSSGQYFDSSLQKCAFCPANCTTCSTISGIVKCDSCNSDYVLQGTPQRCRLVCTADAPFYNATLDRCVSCSAGTYWSKTNRNCTRCPTNCKNCQVDSNSQAITCDSCINNWILDSDVNQCKPLCPSNSQYDWNLQKCTVCPAGTWLNSTQQTCDKCPSNCMSCNLVSGGFECTSCFSDFVVDRKQCRPQCQYPTFFDWSIYGCKNCSTGSYLEPSTTQCKTCPVNCASCFFDFAQSTPDCDSCRAGSVLDADQQRCKLICSSTQFYDWGSNTCQSCSTGTYMIPNSGYCQNCPPGCTGCSYNTNTKAVQCSGCSSGLILDQYQKICRPTCNSSAYFDWDRNDCVNCPGGQYLSPSSQLCSTCPSNCQSCFYNSSNQIECTTCSSNFKYERQTCRETCNSTAYYDWSTGKCTNCKVGSWLNPQTEKCQTCDLGCFSCSASQLNQGLSECQQCLPSLLLDQGYCRKVCSSNQFFDWSAKDCFNCTYPCLKCDNSQTCTTCDEMFSLQTDGTCNKKCIDGQEVWNNQTKTCQSIRKFSVILTNGASKLIRCRNTTVSATPGGLLSGEQAVYTWSYEIGTGGTNRDRWLSDIEGIISAANINNAQRITIPSTLTEKVTDNANLKFNVIMAVGTNQVSNSSSLLIEPHVFTLISNYSSTYTIFASDGLALFPAFTYPECPVFKGPQALPSPTTLSCSLYDSKGNLIKSSLKICGLQPNEVSSGLSYQIRYYFVPNPYQVGVSALRDTIIVNTIAQQPSCSIANATMIYVKTSETMFLKVAVINGRTTFNYQWNCNPLTSGAQCGILQTTQNQADLSIPASSLTVGGQYNFSLNIFDNQVFQTSCSARVEVVSNNPNTLTITYLDSSNSRNYIDPAIQQNILCYQSQESVVPIDYEWKIVRQSDKKVIFATNPPTTTTGISVATQSLIIEKNILSVSGDDYDISCSASNKKYRGSSTKTYTTSMRLKNVQVQLSVYPSSGRAQDTVFSLSVKKPPGQNLWCKFGYVTSTGEINIFDSTTPTYPSSLQTLVTKLDRVEPKETQRVFANCYDSNQAYARDEFVVTVTGQITTMTKSLSNLGALLQSKGSFIESSTQASTRPFEIEEILTTSDQVKKANTSAQLSSQIEHLVNQVRMTAAFFTPAEVDTLIQVFSGVSAQIKGKRDLTIKVVLAISSVLAQEGAVEQTSLDKDSFTELVNIISSMVDSETPVATLKKVMKSIDTGALRVSGNLLVNSDPFSVSSSILALKVVKLSKDKLMEASQVRTSLRPQWKSDFIDITVPYNEKLGNYQTLVILERVWNIDLFENAYMRSDIVDIDIYSSQYPISINGKSKNTKVEVSDLQSSIQINFSGVANHIETSASKEICSYYNEEKQVWAKLGCQSSSVQCCTTHLTSFALIDQGYYVSRYEQDSYMIKVSVVPVIVIACIFIISLVYAKSKMNQTQKQTAIAQNSSADISPTKNAGPSATEFDSSASKYSDNSSISVDQIVIEEQKKSFIMSVIANSKIGQMFQVESGDWVHLLRTRLALTIVFFSCFVVSTSLVKTLTPTSSVFVGWISVAVIELALCLISRLSNLSRAFTAVWTFLLCLLALIQAVLLVTLSQTLTDALFSDWLAASVTTLVLSIVVQDILIKPLAVSVFARFQGLLIKKK